MKKTILIPALACFLLLCGWETGAQTDQLDLMMETAGDARVKVMTRNIYVGADVDIILGAQDPNEVPILAAQAFAQMMSTNFPERAVALAKEIKMHKPHLIGLQEVYKIRFQKEGDAAMGGMVPATQVLFNYLKILRAALAAEGLDYQVAAKVKNIDLELPMYNPEAVSQLSDVRVTDYDVILARGDVEILAKYKGSYQAQLIVPSAGITVPRGWVAVDAKIRNRTFHFVNTHFEVITVPELLPLQMAQAQELLTILSMQTNQVILVGDFNSMPKGDDVNTQVSYNFIRNNGYVDAWRRFDGRSGLIHNKAGNTYGHDYGLRNEAVDMYERVDHIWVRSDVYTDGKQDIGTTVMDVVGDELADRTPSGLWPSDHAGVVAYLWIPKY
ncbi:endonuclease/exonuclease/phosphatase family protein [Acidobacteriota bacterium]